MECSQRPVTKNKIRIHFSPVKRLYSINSRSKCDKCSFYVILIAGLFCTLFPDLRALHRSEFISTRPGKLHLTSPSFTGRCLAAQYVCVYFVCIDYTGHPPRQKRVDLTLLAAFSRQIIYHRPTAIAGLTKSVLRCDRLSSSNIPWSSFVCIHHLRIVHRASSLYSMDSEQNVWELY